MHLLLAFFVEPNAAVGLLNGRGITEDRVLDVLAEISPRSREDSLMLLAIVAGACDVAREFRAPLSSLHLLATLAGSRSQAASLLVKCGVELRSLSAMALVKAAGESPRMSTSIQRS